LFILIIAARFKAVESKMETLKEQGLFVKGSSAESLKLGLQQLQSMIRYDI
jgi:hypothetical protein